MNYMHKMKYVPWALGVKSLVQQLSLKKPGFKLTTPCVQTCCISSIEWNFSSKKLLPSGIRFQFCNWGQKLLSFAFRACVVNGESPLCNVKRPWRFNWHAANPNSYAACEILIRTESPITTLGGSLFRKTSPERAPEGTPERAWAKVFPDSVRFVFLGTGASMKAINCHGYPMNRQNRVSFAGEEISKFHRKETPWGREHFQRAG